MLKRGPVDLVVFAMGEPNFDGSIIRELKKQTASGTIRVLDVMVLFKSATGEEYRVDIEDLPESDLAALNFKESETWGLFDSDDAETLWEGMVPDSGIVALAIEHRWAIDLVNTLEAKGVEVAFSYRVPAPVVDDAFASMEADN